MPGIVASLGVLALYFTVRPHGCMLTRRGRAARDGKTPALLPSWVPVPAGLEDAAEVTSRLGLAEAHRIGCVPLGLALPGDGDGDEFDFDRLGRWKWPLRILLLFLGGDD